MNKTELESKHLSDLHALAAETEIPGYRMLRREELIEKLSDGDGDQAGDRGAGRERGASRGRDAGRARGAGRERGAARRPKAEEPVPPPQRAERAPAAEEEAKPKRKRRRRRFGRRSKSVRVQDLLTQPAGRQALVYAEDRGACTALLRELAAELADGSIALLVDPGPEELADWKREAPQAELVVAAQARHAGDALAQAVRRAEQGEDVILLVDSLTRLEDGDAAKEIFDAAGTQDKGTLTVVAALERQS